MEDGTMGSKNPDMNKIKNNFVKSLLEINREEITEFIKQKGKEPKKIKPFIFLPQSTKVEPEQ